ncbi:MAG: helix-turn-helix transcriptional regulator [Planctomycetes bacterium]|nr:helix-turn-helix transcriptional regulator [Planctomycetota bacterium]
MSDDERRTAEAIRAGAKRDYPPKAATTPAIPSGLPNHVHTTRRKRGMTRYELGKKAGVPATVVRAIELGDDVPLSHFQAVVEALGLTMELVEQS